jgi:deoxyribodipyrimidine photo-lyase
MRTAIVWFRRDLRLADNPALNAALAVAERVVPLYVHAPDEEAPWPPGGASRWWQHHSLAALDAALAARGARLVLRSGPSLSALLEIASASGATRVYWNRAYEPAVVARDTQLEAALREHGLGADSLPGNLLLEPWNVQNGTGEPYRVFTPFWRACQPRLAGLAPPAAAPAAIPLAAGAPPSVPLAALGLLPRLRWDQGLAAAWTPGEAGALARLASFAAGPLAGYAENRNRPDLAGCSRLSPHLHFGEVSPRQVVARIGQASPTGPGPAAGAESFIRQLLWRDFAHHVLYHFPHSAEQPLDARFADFGWREDPAALAAWQRGATGIPLVDAGMRELEQTGYMHNRVRMLVASLLTKNLGLDWLHGARWFHDTLVDADLANNTLGWQWTAGCGADAAPYYRIFSATLQAERFDPRRDYLRRWLPELRALPDEWLHRPFEAPGTVLAAAGVELGRSYPKPLVDLKASRERALAAWQLARGTAANPRRGRPRTGPT